MTTIEFRLRTIAVAVTVAVLAGCAVGPDFRTPAAPEVKTYTSTPLPRETVASAGTGGSAQHFVSGQDIPAQWWELFHSGQLDTLIRQSLAGNPTLDAAQATLREAQENLRARTGTVYYPGVDGSFTAARQKFTGASFGQPEAGGNTFSLFNASVNVSYVLDLFGGGRRELEALKAQVGYQRFQLEGARLTIASSVVTTAVQESSLRAQILATREILAVQEKQLDLVQRQFKLGGASRSDVLVQQTMLMQTRALLPPLEKDLARTRHLLAVLAGRFPGEAAAMHEFNINELQLPGELPVSLPSSVVKQRPDIRAAEELMHAASAQIGVATANLYPQITLTGSLGSESTAIENLFTSGTSIWSLGAGLLQPIFHGGELTARRRAAIAAYDQAAAQYRQVVLQAFQNVADVLRALDLDAQALKAQVEAEAASRETLEVTQKQFELGAVRYLSLLVAVRQYQQARINTIQAQAARFADTAALFQALGGGWWNRGPEAGAVKTAKKE
ncbi:MAG TPA: efflux transporter outer membrane subunit [Geobacteraceae bacterium]|nr:efflux transporter outer membrane subunit [Geobacteraceae bacterium]